MRVERYAQPWLHPTPRLTALCPPHQPWLQGTIHQVFENAVQQPTFVAMYADLCRELDAALPEFHAPGARRLPQGCCLLSLCSVLPPGCLLQVCGLDVALPRMHKCKQLHPKDEVVLTSAHHACCPVPPPLLPCRRGPAHQLQEDAGQHVPGGVRGHRGGTQGAVAQRSRVHHMRCLQSSAT